jgi:hypothetical protein
MGKRKKTHEFEDQYGGGAKPQDVEQFGFSKGERQSLKSLQLAVVGNCV